MKWGIIFLSVVLVAGTLIDLYFSLVVRTYYLSILYYPDILEELDRLKVTSQKTMITPKV